MTNSKGLSIHIGLNRIDTGHYGTDGSLAGCENDARAMQAIATELGYESIVLLTERATAAAVLGAVRAAASRLESGDVLLVSYAGHGAQVPDEADSADESDGRDETWCVYDRMIVDDELYALWNEVKPGVLILVVSDSCHSGTVARRLRATSGEVVTFRALPRAVALQAFDAHREQYRVALDRVPRTALADVSAPLILLAGCQDEQLSSDGAANGLFTEKLLAAWNRGEFTGGYPDFVDAIVRLMPRPSEQTPSIEASDAAAPYLPGRPFKIPAAAKTNGAAHPVADPAPVSEPTPACAPAANTPVKHHSNYKEDNMNMVIDNGNWADVAPLIAAEVQSKRGIGSADFMAQVIAANARSAELALRGGNGYGATATYPGTDAEGAVANRGGSVFRTFWWGFHVQMSREDLQFLYSASNPNGPIAVNLRRVIPRDYLWIMDIVLTFLQVAAAIIKSADRGYGVYISMSWFAPGIFVPTPV